MKDLKSSLKLYAVTDSYWLNGRNLEDDVEKAIIGGVTMVQLREKELDTDSFIKLAFKVKKVCNKYDIPFIINDSLEVFKAVDADGIHVGQNDMRADLVREEIGPNKILGVSAETVEEAILAEKMGADYLGVGTIFNTTTKLDAITVSMDTLRNICDSVKIPVVAIGGINKDNISKLKNTMIDGVSVVSAIFAANDITKATQELDLEISKIILDISKYKLFIVDYDGTLLDSINMWDNIMSRYVSSKGVVPSNTLDNEIRAMTVDEAAEYVGKLYFSDKYKDEILNDVNEFIKREYLKIPLIDGAEKFLKDINKKGRVVLYTATTQPLIKASLIKNDVLDYFDYLYTSTNYNETKTNPNGYLNIMRQLGFKPSETLIVEDAPHALEGASKAGSDILAIRTDVNIKKTDIIINCPSFYINLRRY